MEERSESGGVEWRSGPPPKEWRSRPPPPPPPPSPSPPCPAPRGGGGREEEEEEVARAVLYSKREPNAGGLGKSFERAGSQERTVT